MLASRFLLHYFAVEIIFGVPNHFGCDTNTVLKGIAEIFAHGMLKRAGLDDDRPSRSRPLVEQAIPDE